MEIKDLNPNKKNPRKISDKKLGLLKRSIDKFGDLSGFVYNVRTKRLISGHQRQKSIPADSQVVIQMECEPTEARTVAEGYVEANGERFKYREIDADEVWETEAMLAANKHGGEWDQQLLQDAISLSGLDLEVSGFDIPELKEIDIKPPEFESDEEYARNNPGEDENLNKEVIGGPPPRDEKEDEIPEVKKSRFTPGSTIKIGPVTVSCGDSTDLKFVESVLHGKKIDFVFTDPPYGIDEKTDRDFASRSRLCAGGKFEKIIGDKDTSTAKKAIQIIDVIDPKASVIFGVNHFAHALPETANWLVWDKRITDHQQDMNSDAELAWVKSKYKSVRIFRHLWKGMIKGSEHGQKRVHPTQKPIALAEWCIKEYAPDCKTVLDLFGGSGSTAVACVNLKKECFIFEMSPDYCEIIAVRVEQALTVQAN